MSDTKWVEQVSPGGEPTEWVLMSEYPTGVILVFIAKTAFSRPWIVDAYRWYVFVNSRQFASGMRTRLEDAQEDAVSQMLIESNRAL